MPPSEAREGNPTTGLRCPYCGQESPQEPLSNCYYCSKELGQEYIVLIDEDGDPFALCSPKCMENLFEFLEAEAEEEE